MTKLEEAVAAFRGEIQLLVKNREITPEDACASLFALLARFIAAFDDPIKRRHLIQVTIEDLADSVETLVEGIEYALQIQKNKKLS